MRRRMVLAAVTAGSVGGAAGSASANDDSGMTWSAADYLLLRQAVEATG